MKKTLEDELMGLAHRILRLRGREDLEQMKALTGELYEKLTVLSFAEKHFAGPQPTIGLKDIEEALKEEDTEEVTEGNSAAPEQGLDATQTSETPTQPQPFYPAEPEPEKAEWVPPAPSQLPETEEIEEESPIFEGNTHPFKEEEPEEMAPEYEVSLPENLNLDAPVAPEEPDLEADFTSEEIDLREIAVHFDDLPQFEPVDSVEESPQPEESKEEEIFQPQNMIEEENVTETEIKEPVLEEKVEKEKTIPSSPLMDLFSGIERPKTRNELNPHKRSLNESIKIGLSFGLNDRIAFINNLFEGNSEDFNRVISQLNTFEKYTEARMFIEEQVKPDYNWEDKTQYEERFYQALEHRMED